MFNPNSIISNQQTIKVGSLTYNPKFQILASDDDSVTLRFKLNKVLNNLIERKEDLVTRDELIKNIWAGNHYIGEKALTHTICKLRKIFSLLGDEQIKIITVPKSGYCLL